jgi:hypothetical protein
MLTAWDEVKLVEGTLAANCVELTKVVDSGVPL